MSNLQPLANYSGTLEQLQAADTLVVGAGVLSAAATDLALGAPASHNVNVQINGSTKARFWASGSLDMSGGNNDPGLGNITIGTFGSSSNGLYAFNGGSTLFVAGIQGGVTTIGDGTNASLAILSSTTRVDLGSTTWKVSLSNTQTLKLESASSLLLGQGDGTSTPSNFTLRAGNNLAGTFNTAGANLTLVGGLGTGNAAPASIIVQTSTPGSFGTTLQSAQEVARFGQGLAVGTTSDPGLGQIRATGVSLGTSPIANIALLISGGGLVLPQRTDTGSTVTITIADCLVESSGTGATINLPAIGSGATVPNGYVVILRDAKGTAGSSNITITPSGSDTIDGGTGGASTTIATNYGVRCLVARATNNWATLFKI